MAKLETLWAQLQRLLDVKSGAVMFLFTGAIIARVIAVMAGSEPLSMAEATAYSTCIAAFGYSNGKPS